MENQISSAHYVAPFLLLLHQVVYDKGGVDVWVKPLTGSGRFALLLVNHAIEVVDFEVSWEKHLPDVNKAWARDQHFKPPSAEKCEDKDKGCPGWAANGECERNPGRAVWGCKEVFLDRETGCVLEERA